MSKTTIVRKSFNGGEIAPDLWFRSDLEAHHNSCKSLLNMNVTPWGGAERRPPMELLAKIDTATYGVPVKYLPFKFSLTETFHVVFTDGSGSSSPSSSTADLIVFDSAGTLVTLEGASTKIIDTVYDPADLVDLHYIGAYDFIYMTCGGKYPVQAINRFYDETESSNRWKIGNSILVGGPYGSLNIESSKKLSVFMEPYDAAHSYSIGDVVPKSGATQLITGAIYEYRYEEYWDYNDPEYGGDIWLGDEEFWELTITIADHGYLSGDRIYLDGVNLDGIDVDGVYRVWSVTTDTFKISLSEPNNPNNPVVTLDADASSSENSATNDYGFYRSATDANVGNDLDNASHWDFIETYKGLVTLKASADMFVSTDVGRNVKLRNGTNAGLNDKYTYDRVSRGINGFGTATLTTEGGTWYGTLELQQSNDNGTTWETIGSYKSYDVATNGSFEREVSEFGALVRVRLKNYASPTGTHEVEACVWRLEFANNYYSHFQISSYVDARTVTASIQTPISELSVDTRWALGSFSQTTGFPYTLAIHDERMVFGGSAERPNTAWASRINDWSNFISGDTAVSPYTFTIKSDSFDAIQWIRSTRELMVGTENSEATLGALSDSEAVTVTNVKVKTHTYFGSANLQAVVTADLIFFVQGQAKRVRSSQYDFGTDQYLSSEMSIYSHHITEQGIKEMSFTRDPYSMLFFTMKDGKAVTFTYERDNAVKGWARLELGGSGSIVSAASNYTPAGDSVFSIVQRNGEYTLEGFTKTTDASVYLDGQIQFVDQDYSAGVSVPIDSTGAVVVRDDVLLDPADYTIAANVLTIPGETDGTVTIGWPVSFEIAPTNSIETGDFGTIRKVEKVSLYLLDSGGCDVSLNGVPSPFQDSINLAATERLDGEYELSTHGNFDSKANVVLSGNHHKPFKILGLGFDVSRHT